MSEIRFDLGKNIVETAKQSGVPAFQNRDVNGTISYSVNDIPPVVTAIYTRPGYEIRVDNLFAFTLYADRNRSEQLLVDTVDLQPRARFKSHAEAQAFATKVIAQFKQGRWRRDYAGDPARLTGRSSILGEDGQLDGDAASPDPDYVIPPEDWKALIPMGLVWRWSGDGVRAKLHIWTSGSDWPDGSPSYSVYLDFEDAKAADEVAARNEAYDNEKLKAQGVDIAARDKKNQEEQEARNKILEQNAIKRGDKVLSKPAS
ncbi:hypothetical protein [Bordetella sp. N]|uniref:hypothetical protein n=1 Tax=Bordetella sp. N TaxID=1746199 RepID=UPI000B1C2CDE|nr:hypothetical protein [Bordetella sp. N]